MFKRIVTAYELLCDDGKRRVYNIQWHLRFPKSSTSTTFYQNSHTPAAASPAACAAPADDKPATARPSTASAAAQRMRADMYNKQQQTSGVSTASFKFSFDQQKTANYESCTGGFAWQRPPPAVPSTASLSDSHEKIQHDRAAAASRSETAPTAPSKPAANVCAYAISPEEQEQLKAMRDRDAAAQAFDMSAWERIKRRPSSATAARTCDVPHVPVPTHAPRAEYDTSKPVQQPTSPSQASREAFRRAQFPVPKAAPPAPAAEAPEEPLRSGVHSSATCQAHGVPQQQGGSAPPAAPRRPFSAGLFRPQQSPAQTPTVQPTTAVPTPISTSPPLDLSSSESFVVPSDKDMTSLSDEELKVLLSRLEKKVKVARQVALIRSFQV